MAIIMKKIAIINQKGGVCKSTNALNIGAALSHKGKKVLYIDLDAQGSLSFSMKVNTAQSGNAMAILEKQTIAVDDIQQTSRGDAIASTPLLSNADIMLTQVGKEYRLKKALETLPQKYDYCIIDTPPALSIVTVNALTACTGAIIPAQTDIFSLQGITQLNVTINAVKEYCNPNLYIMGIVLNRYNARTILNREVEKQVNNVAEQMDTKVYNTKIRECIAVKEAQALQEDIFSYAPKSNAAIDYVALSNEIVREFE